MCFQIGAGIQMTPNVARLLRRYGIDKEIGDNLVRYKEMHLRRANGKRVGYVLVSRMEKAAGEKWWLVHRYVVRSVFPMSTLTIVGDIICTKV